jgi:hypothetical protein
MKRVFMLVAALAALVVMQLPATAEDKSPVDSQVRLEVDTSVCEQLTATVVNVPAESEVKFRLGHDLEFSNTPTEQDTAVQWKTEAPPGTWGLSVTVGGKNLTDRQVTIKDCEASSSGTLTVTDFDCETVTVVGTGWPQSNATIEVVLPPHEGGETRDDYLDINQVFPDDKGNFTTTLQWPEKPFDGKYTVGILYDNVERHPSPAATIFEVSGCRGDTPGQSSGQLPFTGGSTVPMLVAGMVLLLAGALLVRRTRTQ